MSKPDDWGTMYFDGEPLGIYTEHPMKAECQEIAGECPHCHCSIRIAVPPISDPRVYIEELKHKHALKDEYIRKLEKELGL